MPHDGLHYRPPMRFTVLAVLTGLAIGYLTGGRFRHLGARGLRMWPFLAAGLLLQVASERLGSPAGVALLLASYALLVAFAAANVALVGMWLVALGIGLNLLTIAVNRGMPVRPSAMVAAGIAGPEEVQSLDIGGKRHLERASDRLLVISDVIPVRPLREVVSFGDVVMAVGIADVLVHLLHPPRRRGAHAEAAAQEVEVLSKAPFRAR